MTRYLGLRFVQEEPSTDGSFDVSRTYVFFVSFVDVRNGMPCRLKYVIRAEKIGEVVAIKFYASRDRKSPYDKYSLAHRQLGPGAVLHIMGRCIDVIKDSIALYPDSSFVIKASEAYDPTTQKLEDERENQRFRIYRAYLAKKVGHETFAHFQFREQSIYLLVRRTQDEDIENKKDRLMAYLYSRFGL